MNFEELAVLNKELAEQSKAINKDFFEIFKKWVEKSPKVTLINMMNLPINMFLCSASECDNNETSELFPELPFVYMRMIRPFVKLRNEWGKIPDKEFCKIYVEIYESQFDEWLPSDEDKESFKKWFQSNDLITKR